MERLTEMMTFVKVVETRSFSAAARQLGSSKSLVSKRVANLEHSLGVRLLTRSTRSMSLTESGTAFYEQCARIAQAIAAAEQTVTRLQEQPRGLLKVTTPVIFGGLYMARLMKSFRERYPDVEIEVNASDRMVDLVEEGYDLAIRLTDDPSPSVVAKRLAPLRWVTCAAPSYLERHGTPQSPQDLLHHECLVYHGPPMQPGWRYRIDGKLTTLNVTGHYRVNTSEVMMQMALAGMGITLAPTYVLAQHLKSGGLVEILPDSIAYPDKSLWVTYLPNRYMQPKVRAFIDHIFEYFGPNPDWATR